MTERDEAYDVVIAGGSIAGCAAAMLLGRAGHRVAVLERSRRPDAYKALCGHFVLGGAKPTLERLGLWDVLTDHGASVCRPAIWTAGGWIEFHADVPPAISLRRSVLDPLLRRMAGDTPGVDVLLGHEVVDLVRDGRRVAGVRVRTADGEVALGARLVVGADGHRSRVATLAGVRASTAPNGRFLYWSYYRDVATARPGACIWFADPDVGVLIPVDGGLTLAGVFGSKERLADFAGDKHAAIEQHLSSLPDGPQFDGSTRASAVIGTSDYPFARRDPAPTPGLALIGDAATTSDPVPAVGCGWAFRSAEWLADAVAPALAGHGSVDRALRRYRRRHRFVERYDRLARGDARATGPNPVQRLVRRAALTDDETRRRLGLFAMQAAPVSGLLNPRAVARAARVALRSG